MRLLLPVILALLPFLTGTLAPAAEPEAAETPTPPPAWLKRADKTGPGAFSPARSYRAKYRFAWSGLTAGRSEVIFSAPPGSEQVKTKVLIATVGAARSLWQMDAVNTAIADRRTLHPIRFDLTDTREKKQIITQVMFTPQGASRSTRTLTKEEVASPPTGPMPKPKSFKVPGLYDMLGALLYIRSHPLVDGESHSAPIMTATAPYLITVKVLGREKLKVEAGEYQAIKCSFDFAKIGKDGNLKPSKKFKGATLWVSDDADRLLLKARAQVYVGAVALELDSVSFGEEPSQ